MAQDQESENSIYDFIYVDHQRVALFLSQFDQSGKLTGLKRSVREIRQKNLSAGIDTVVHAKRESESSATEEMQREFDPQWVLPLTLLDALEDQQLIRRDISAAALGQFVLCSGTLSIVDFAILKSLLELPAFKKQLTVHIDRLEQLGKGKKEMGELLRQFLTILPYNLQATIATPQKEVWCCLKQEGMMLPQAEVFLKHGFSLPGTWYALGLLDARPNESSPIQPPTDIAKSLTEIFTSQLGPIVRQVLGRPSKSFGITPIILFREVSRQSLPQ